MGWNRIAKLAIAALCMWSQNSWLSSVSVCLSYVQKKKFPPFQKDTATSNLNLPNVSPIRGKFHAHQIVSHSSPSLVLNFFAQVNIEQTIRRLFGFPSKLSAMNSYIKSKFEQSCWIDYHLETLKFKEEVFICLLNRHVVCCNGKGKWLRHLITRGKPRMDQKIRLFSLFSMFRC